MSMEIITVLSVMVFTIILMVLEVVRIDVVAILCMLALGWLGILKPLEALSGFSSNAVIAMISVMIMGKGIANTGIMDRLSVSIIKMVGKSRKKLVGLVSLSVGLISAFMQNVGAAALFLPSVLYISKKERIPASELIMPLGFAAILGGTLTMVASGPLIILNDLLRDAELKPFGLFGVTPVGIVLLLVGIIYFFVFGKAVLPRAKGGEVKPSEQKKLIDTWHLPYKVYRYSIPEKSPLVGQTPESSGIWDTYHINLLAISEEKEVEYAPWRKTDFEANQIMALLGDEKDIEKFARDNRLALQEKLDEFKDLSDQTSSGFAEVIIPPRSSLVGNTIRQYALRKNYSVEPLVLFSAGEEIRGDFSDRVIRAGDTLIVHGLWEIMLRMKESSDFVVVTPFEFEKKEISKTWIALACFFTGIGLAIAGFPISISLFSGAVAMVLTRVISINDAYKAIEWKVVFLIAGLIPLGVAMQKTGTASFLAGQVMAVVKGSHPLVILFSIAALSTLFSLFMSNVASTVVLTPLIINMAAIGGLDPRPLVLLVAVCAANSFILPTHQVNAMLMTPGGYRNPDYLRAGSGMTVLFLIVVVLLFYFVYL